MAWGEWEQLKAEAAARASSGAGRGAGHGPGRRAGHGAAGGAGFPDPDLRSDRSVWARAGHDIASLSRDLGDALDRLEHGQGGHAGPVGASCFQVDAAQRELHASWSSYVSRVSRRCRDLGAILQRSGHHLAQPDTSLSAELGRISVMGADTAALGGASSGAELGASRGARLGAGEQG
jgi:hypothetical protein